MGELINGRTAGGERTNDAISRSAAIQALKKAKELASEPPTCFDIYINKIFNLCIRLIAAFDALDAVPVVRCRDCRYAFKNNGHEKDGCPIQERWLWMDGNGFCACGERMDGEADG